MPGSRHWGRVTFPAVSTRNGRETLEVRFPLNFAIILKERPERLESPLPVLAWGVSPITGIERGLRWKLRTLNKPFGVRRYNS